MFRWGFPLADVAEFTIATWRIGLTWLYCCRRLAIADTDGLWSCGARRRCRRRAGVVGWRLYTSCWRLMGSSCCSAGCRSYRRTGGRLRTTTAGCTFTPRLSSGSVRGNRALLLTEGACWNGEPADGDLYRVLCRGSQFLVLPVYGAADAMFSCTSRACRHVAISHSMLLMVGWRLKRRGKWRFVRRLMKIVRWYLRGVARGWECSLQ